MDFPPPRIPRSKRPDVRLISLSLVVLLSFLFSGPARAAPAAAGEFRTAARADMANPKLGCGVTYRVRPGDTLSRIAHRCRVTVAELRRANNLPPRARLAPGRVLQIPRQAMVTPAAETDQVIVTVAASALPTPTIPPDLRKHYLPTPSLDN